MKAEISQFDNLGSPIIFYDLLREIIRSSFQWTVTSLDDYFYNRVIDGYHIFDGCKYLLFNIEAIKIDSNNCLIINNYLISSLNDVSDFSSRFLELILGYLKSSEIFQDIFQSNSLSFDSAQNAILVDNSAFTFQYSNIRKLLLNFDFLQLHPNKNINKFLINVRYKKFFDKYILPQIRSRIMSLSQLNELLDNNRINGFEAETFVVQFEKSRIHDHPLLSDVQKISEFDVGAGYDIVSFENNESTKFDRFIEVKSYTRNPSFYWSNNELSVAKFLKSKYYLYLVDRSLMHLDDYNPIIIPDPFHSIFYSSNQWKITSNDYFIKMRTDNPGAKL